MTSLVDLIARAEAAGIRFRVAPDGVRAVLPGEPVAIYEPLLAPLRARRGDVAAILQRRAEVPSDPCPACGGRYWWRLREGDGWTCGRCQPDPRAARWQGVTLATLGERRIVLRAPSGDLPAVGEWCKLPGGGVGDLLAYTPDGTEALLRLFSPAGQPESDPPRFLWLDPARLLGEAEWCGCRNRA